MPLIADGVWETTTTQGTGDVTLLGAKEGKRGFGAAFGNGGQCYYEISGSWGFERGLGTVSVGGTTALQRTTVLSTNNGDTSRISLPAGRHNVLCALLASQVALVGQVNEWAADQRFNGKKLFLDAAESLRFWASAAAQIDWDFGGVSKLRLLQENGRPYLIVRSDEGSDDEGPELELDRLKSPGAANDALGVVRFIGRDGAGNRTTYAKIRGEIGTATDGTEAGRLAVGVASAGALGAQMLLGGTYCRYGTGVNVFTGGGKSSSNPATVGAEMLASGQLVGSVSGALALILNAGADGTILSFRRANAEVAGISIASGVATYGTMTFHHDSWWAGGPPEGGARLFEVLESAPGWQAGRDHLPLCRRAAPNSRAVYGVYGGEELDQNGNPRVKVVGGGVFKVLTKGPVAHGDLLVASEEAGVARALAEGEASPVNPVGICRQDDPTDAPARPVAVTLKCG